MSYTLTLMFRVSPSSMFEVGALEVKVLIWRAEQGAEQGGVKVELKVSTCVLLHANHCIQKYCVSLLRAGQM